MTYTALEQFSTVMLLGAAGMVVFTLLVTKGIEVTFGILDFIREWRGA